MTDLENVSHNVELLHHYYEVLSRCCEILGCYSEKVSHYYDLADLIFEQIGRNGSSHTASRTNRQSQRQLTDM